MTRRRSPKLGWRERGPDCGDVFVEALVATAIVAMVLAATFRVIADGATRERQTDARRLALLVAKSEMAEVGADIPLIPGESAGYAGGQVWRVTVAPYDGAGGANSAGALMKVHVSVRPRTGGADLVALDSLRLAPQA
ncbi:MAG: hypothetical protein ACR2F8_14530 [Caulobacteraceae bacterium]